MSAVYLVWVYADVVDSIWDDEEQAKTRARELDDGDGKSGFASVDVLPLNVAGGYEHSANVEYRDGAPLHGSD